MFVILIVVLIIDTVLVIILMIYRLSLGEIAEIEENVFITRINSIRTIMTLVFPNLNAKRATYNLKLQNSKICIDILNQQFHGNFTNSSTGFDWNEPGIGKLAFYNLITFLAGVLCLAIVENKFGFSFISKQFDKVVDFMKEKISPGSTLPVRAFNIEIEEDVKAEADRLASRNLDELVLEEPLVVRNLCKVFKKGSKRFYAVDDLNFGVASAECFGLLGLNGAGKTTTIEILTGQLEASRGKAYLNGFNMKKDRLKAIGHLGICPQFVIIIRIFLFNLRRLLLCYFKINYK